MKAHDNRPDIRGAYDRWSESYDTAENRTRDLDRRLLPRLAPPLVGKTVVEVGCGTGKNSIWLAPRCARLIGLDFSGRMLARARQKLQGQPAVHLVRCDVTRAWPLRGVLADLVLINLVLEHVAALGPVFAQAARILHPGGELLISEFNPARIEAGQGARIEGEDGVEWVGSYAHAPEAYREAGEAAGLAVLEMAAWDDEGRQYPVTTATEPLPRLLTVRLEMGPANF